MTRGVLIIGSGKRVREAALPALAAMRGELELLGTFARTAKTVEAAGESYEVEPLDALTPERLRAADLLYLAVTKDAVPSVLARLADMDPSGVDLLIDTPVVRFKHFRHTRRIEAFRDAWVSEDCATLPWIDLVRAAEPVIGPLRRVHFAQSAYAYHGVATAKTLLGERVVRRGFRRRLGGEAAERVLTFRGGAAATVLEPRDYAVGHVELHGSTGCLTDARELPPGALRMEGIFAGGTCVGFRAGELETRLDEAESRVLGEVAPGTSPTAMMDELKRVGFLRLLRDYVAGRGAYPLLEALDDMAVDYHLEKLGRYVANPFTSPRAGLGRFLLSTLTRVAKG